MPLSSIIPKLAQGVRKNVYFYAFFEKSLRMTGTLQAVLWLIYMKGYDAILTCVENVNGNVTISLQLTDGSDITGV
ncbi:hypothetical protein [Virgibacillus dakarensis]|uniref:hypothetical protein n=1 Tax=Virgibacillus dakarensis TaxID=1917889 RepID=UPI000B42FA51|nr:hypothetical protein [Virgibacillus dakarensis]